MTLLITADVFEDMNRNLSNLYGLRILVCMLSDDFVGQDIWFFHVQKLKTSISDIIHSIRHTSTFDCWNVIIRLSDIQHL